MIIDFRCNLVILLHWRQITLIMSFQSLRFVSTSCFVKNKQTHETLKNMIRKYWLQYLHICSGCCFNRCHLEIITLFSPTSTCKPELMDKTLKNTSSVNYCIHFKSLLHNFLWSEHWTILHLWPQLNYRRQCKCFAVDSATFYKTVNSP